MCFLSDGLFGTAHPFWGVGANRSRPCRFDIVHANLAMAKLPRKRSSALFARMHTLRSHPLAHCAFSLVEHGPDSSSGSPIFEAAFLLECETLLCLSPQHRFQAELMPRSDIAHLMGHFGEGNGLNARLKV